VVVYCTIRTLPTGTVHLVLLPNGRRCTPFYRAAVENSERARRWDTQVATHRFDTEQGALDYVHGINSAFKPTGGVVGYVGAEGCHTRHALRSYTDTYSDWGRTQ
jgi:hypothetical protein